MQLILNSFLEEGKSIMDTIRKSKTSLLSILGMLGIAACISFAIDPPLDTELNDIPGDTHLGEWVQAISSNQVSESVYATNGNLVVNGMEYPVGGGGGSEEEIVALSNRVNAIENAGYVATNEYGSLSLNTPESTLEADNLNIHSYASIGITEGTLYVGAEGSSSYLFVGGTNVMERIDEIASSGGDLTPVTNYVDAVTNNLRAKADMVVYELQNVWKCESIQPPIFMFGGAAETGYPNTWTNGVGWKLAWGYNMWMLWDADSGSAPNWTTGGSLDAQTIMFWEDDPSQNFTRTEIVGPSDDRLATTGGVAVAIAAAVPAGVVTTNDNGEIGANLSLSGELSVAGGITTGGMTVYGSASVDGGDFVVGGTSVMDAIIATSNAIPAEIGLAISTNNPAFVAAVTNIIQNLPQDTLQALKAALNALP